MKGATVRSLRTLLVASALLPTLALTACGSDEKQADPPVTASATTSTDGVAAGVEVVPSIPDVDIDTKDPKSPKVTLKQTPLRVDSSQVQVLTPGTGDKITDTMAVTIDYVLVNARDGKTVQSSLAAGQPEVLTMNETMPGMAGALKNQQVGAKLLATLTPRDAFGPRGGVPERGIEVSDPVVVYMEVKSAKTPLTKATGKAVPPKKDLPTVKFNDAAPATITIPKGVKAPTSMVAQPLIEGTGAKVTQGQTITVHYTGVTYADGKMFDSSFTSGKPASFAIGVGQVISCWDKALVGKNIGSRYLLVCPAADAYKDQERPGIPKNSTLVFVVDILDATTPVQQSAAPTAAATK